MLGNNVKHKFTQRSENNQLCYTNIKTANAFKYKYKYIYTTFWEKLF